MIYGTQSATAWEAVLLVKAARRGGDLRVWCMEASRPRAQRDAKFRRDESAFLSSLIHQYWLPLTVRKYAGSCSTDFTVRWT